MLGFIAASALGLAAFKGSYFDPGNIDLLFLALFLLGVATLIALLVASIYAPIEEWATADRSLCVRAARRTELEELLPFYQKVIGGPMPSMNEIKRIFGANNQIVRLLENVRRSNRRENRKIVGFCSIFPLKKLAVALLEREQLNGLKMTHDYVCKLKEDPSAIYIGSIGAIGAEPKAAILNYVLGVIHEHASQGMRAVYTRPTTKDGLRVAKQYGFEAVAKDAGRDELGRMYKLKSAPTSRARRSKTSQLAQDAG